MEIKNWQEAELWQKNANEGKDEFEKIIWSWDCNFKLDYDGSLLRVSSRFYPPAFKYGPGWDGTVHLYLGDKEITKKDFDCQTLDDLKNQVEEYVEHVQNCVSNIIQENEWRLKRISKPSWLQRLLKL